MGLFGSLVAISIFAKELDSEKGEAAQHNQVGGLAQLVPCIQSRCTTSIATLHITLDRTPRSIGRRLSTDTRALSPSRFWALVRAAYILKSGSCVAMLSIVGNSLLGDFADIVERVWCTGLQGDVVPRGYLLPALHAEQPRERGACIEKEAAFRANIRAKKNLRHGCVPGSKANLLKSEL